MNSKEVTFVRTGSTQDQGFAWVIMAASFLLCIFKGGQFGNLGYFLVKFLTHYKISKSQVTIIGALSLFLGNIFALLAGILIKRYGCRSIAIWSSVLVGISYALSVLLESLPIIYIFFSAIAGMGFLGMHLCGRTSCQQYFNKRRSFATSLCATGTGLGVLIYPPLTYLLDSWYGWRGALLIQGAIFMNGAVCGAVLRPYVEIKADKETPKLTCKTLCPFIGLCTKQPSKESSHSFLPFYSFLLGCLLVQLGHVTMIVYTPLRAKMNGISSEKGAFLVSLIGFLSLTRFMFGWLGDKKWSNRSVLLGSSSVIGGVLMISSTFIGSFIPLAIVQGLYGFASAGCMALQAAVLVDTVGLTNVTMANGAHITVLGLSNLLTNVGTGALIDATGSAITPFWVFGIAQIIAGICFLAIPLLQRNSNNTIDVSIQEELS